MRIFAYSMLKMAETTWQATGVYPVTCPPFSADLFPARIMEGYDFIWLGLHGTTDDPNHLFGDLQSVGRFPLRVEALSVEQIQPLDLSGSIVFAPTCHLPTTAFPDALKQVGAQVIGGPGENYGSRKGIIGADLLGATLINVLRMTKMGQELAYALTYAKTSLRARRKADRDAMEFTVL